MSLSARVYGVTLQAQASEARQAKLSAEKAQADDKVAAVAARLPELEADKRAAAAKKVGATHILAAAATTAVTVTAKWFRPEP
jgi:hypothetical protein